MFRNMPSCVAFLVLVSGCGPAADPAEVRLPGGFILFKGYGDVEVIGISVSENSPNTVTVLVRDQIAKVGWNNEYTVAIQHPRILPSGNEREKGDRRYDVRRTLVWILVAETQELIGPLTEEEFGKESGSRKLGEIVMMNPRSALYRYGVQMENKKTIKAE